LIRAEDFQLIQRVISTLRLLLDLIQRAHLTLRRLRRMIFGPQTEKSSQLLSKEAQSARGGGSTPPKEKPKGHGRNGAEDYPGAKRIPVAHTTLQPGCECPLCRKGRLFEMTKPAPVILEVLVQMAAQAWLFYQDDTRMKVLSLLRENARLAEGGAKERTGIFTTGILAQVGEHRIILFFTGRKHAGENLQSVLEQRQDGLPAPIQMCDGSSSNQVKGTQTLEANCNSHYPD
jgi:hypothetical protein